ncbi:MAG: adenylyltransferase/cytidyltransferase family protein, partial [Candidatus Dojkabacteria bacterium]
MINVIVAGTFNKFHIGHESLISKALEIGDKVTICIMSDKYAKDNKNRVVPYEYRQKQVMNFLLNKHVDFSKINIITSDNSYSCSFLTNFDAMVVSEETQNNAYDIN